jgi:hypothetical protein
MSVGRPCADSAAMVSHRIEGKNLVDQATKMLGETPILWGRYFTNSSGGGDAEYRHLRENELLRGKGIRVLPIARQTGNVSGSQADGSDDASRNADDILNTFGVNHLESMGGEVVMFLDVEGAPPLSPSYWTGWARTVVARSGASSDNKVKILPCLYATQGDKKTWQALADAVNAAPVEAACHGAWVARWRIRGHDNPSDVRPPEFDPEIVNPAITLPCPILLWQYADEILGSGGFDCDQTNPNVDIDGLLVSKCVLPPSITDLIS